MHETRASPSACDQVCFADYTYTCTFPAMTPRPQAISSEEDSFITYHQQRIDECDLEYAHSMNYIQMPYRSVPASEAEAEDDVPDTALSSATLMGLPNELFQQIVADMVVAVGVRGSTNLRLVNKTFDNLVVYSLFKGGLIQKKHILDSRCRKCQIPASLLSRFLTIKLDSVPGRESYLGQLVKETFDRFVEIQQLVGSNGPPRETIGQHLLDIISERVSAGEILSLEETTEREEDTRESDISQGLVALAAALGDVKAMNAAITQYGGIVDQDSEHFTTAIHAAARSGQTGTAKLLLDQKAKAIPKFAPRSTPLEIASYGGHEDMVKLLLDDKHHDFEIPASLLESAMRFALKGGHAKLIQVFLKYDDDKVEQGSAPSLSPPEILLMGAASGNKEIVQDMLLTGVDIDTIGIRETRLAHAKNALECAAASGRLDMVKLLLDWGISRNQDRYHNAFVLAVREQRTDVARFLLEDGADINHIAPRPNHWREHGSALMTAASHNACEMVGYLLDNGVDLSTIIPGRREESQGACALTSACRRGHSRVARQLVDAGVNPNKLEWTRGKGGKSNIYYARKSGVPGIVETLYQLGAVESVDP